MTRSARAFGAVSALACALLAATACSKHEPPPPGETHVVPAPPAPPSHAGAPVRSPEASSAPAPPKGLATEEDFEDESAAKVTPETLDAQLDALEKEIQAE